MKRLNILLAGAAVYVVLGACSSQRAPAAGPQSGRSDEAAVQVMNNHWSDMVVYADRGGSRVRLGMVTSMATQMLTIPRAVLGTARGFQLVVSPIGSPSIFATERLSVFPGQVVEFRVENQLGLSTVSVWGK